MENTDENTINGNWRLHNPNHRSIYIFSKSFGKKRRNSSYSSRSYKSSSKSPYSSFKSFKAFKSFNSYKSKSFQNKRAIVSYGIIPYSIFTRKDERDELKYLISQKKDTIPYTEFLRNKLSREQLPGLIPYMSKDEKKRIIKCYLSEYGEDKKDKEDKKDEEDENLKFIDLWLDLWTTRHKVFNGEFDIAIIDCKKNIELYWDLFNDETIGLDENPWEFPKGRKHQNETSIRCALRECEEETKISQYHLILTESKPYIENYIGFNGRSYKSVYYIAIIDNQNLTENTYNSTKFRKYITDETQDIKWVTLDEARSKLDPSKIKILEVVNKNILKDIDMTLNKQEYNIIRKSLLHNYREDKKK